MITLKSKASLILNGADSVGRFRRSIRSLTSLLVVCFFSFTLRTIMLVLRLLLVENGREIMPLLSPYGIRAFISTTSNLGNNRKIT